MIVKLLTEHHLAFLSLKGGYRGSSESTLVKMSNCWKSHVAAQLQLSMCVNSKSNANKINIIYWILNHPITSVLYSMCISFHKRKLLFLSKL